MNGTANQNGETENDEDAIPLQNQRPFGSSIKRKQVVFVPASTGPLVTTEQTGSSAAPRSISDLYLSMVLPESPSESVPVASEEADIVSTCQVCSLPLSGRIGGDASNSPLRPHEASIAHQVCLVHSHPPSALDRSRMGLQVLQSQGWDLDSRAGLGAHQQGIQHPIKAAPKNNTLGIGVLLPKNLPPKKEKAAKLDAGKVRKSAAENKKRSERLRQELFGDVDIEKYLGRPDDGTC